MTSGSKSVKLSSLLCTATDYVEILIRRGAARIRDCEVSATLNTTLPRVLEPMDTDTRASTTKCSERIISLLLLLVKKMQVIHVYTKRKHSKILFSSILIVRNASTLCISLRSTRLNIFRTTEKGRNL